MIAAGVRTLSLGVNTGSAPPGTPKFTPFLWEDEESGEELLVFVHPGKSHGLYLRTFIHTSPLSTSSFTPDSSNCMQPLTGGYGGISRVYPDSTEEVFLDPPAQCIQGPEGLGHALCSSWRNDNTGGCDWRGCVSGVCVMKRGIDVCILPVHSFSMNAQNRSPHFDCRGLHDIPTAQEQLPQPQK
jgi:hypothetical protein